MSVSLNFQLTGDKELRAALLRLEKRGAKRAATKGIRRGMTTIHKAVRKNAPRGKTGKLRTNVGSRFVRLKGARKGDVEAKVGVGVGKKRKNHAPHSHLVALGTQWRTRKKLGGKFAYITKPTKYQLSTGQADKNSFVQQGFRESAMKARAEIITKTWEEIQKEAAKK